MTTESYSNFRENFILTDINRQMGLLTLIIISLFLISAGWLTDFEKGKQQAQKEHKFILLYFSGRDWCYSCRQTQRQILDKNVFINYSAANLVLVNADFPRNNRNTVSSIQVGQNEQLALQYNKDMVIPMFLLLNDTGKVLKTWTGNPKMSAETFVSQIISARR